MTGSTNVAVLHRPSQPLEAVCARLDDWGCRVYAGSDPAAVLTASDIDVILIDAGLEDGMDLVGWLKAEPGTRSIPVVAVTVGDPGTVAAHALALGADDMITLPIEDAELYARLRALSRLSIMELERQRRETVLAHFGVRTPQEMRGMPALDRLGILLIGPACNEQIQVTTALGGAATVAYAESMERALERLRRQDVEVAVITGMREHEEIEALCAAIREEPALFDLPVMLIGRAEDFPDRGTPFAWGVSDMILRPFHPEILRLRVHCWVRQQRLRRRLRAPLDGEVVPPVVDRLTCLYGHGFLHGYLDYLFAWAREFGGTIALAGFAVAGMQRINREYGFAAGDHVLAQIGTILARTTRAEDLPARLGDDRFCVLVGGATAREAALVAERVATTIAETPLRLGGERTLLVGVRTGIAELRSDDDAASLVARAFEQMEPFGLRRAS